MTLEELSPLLAESMSMSIWLRSDGLAFNIARPEGSGGEVLSGHLPLSRLYPSHLEAVQDLVYGHEWLCYPYQRVYLYYVPRRSSLIPLELYEAQQAALWLEGISISEGERTLSEVLPLERKVLLTAWDRELLAFFERIHPPLTPRPYYLPLIEEERQHSRREACGRLVVALEGNQLDCIAIKQGELAYINHYAVCSEGGQRSLSEMMYYTLSLWQALSLDYQRDVLHCVVREEGDELEQLYGALRAYIGRIQISRGDSLTK